MHSILFCMALRVCVIFQINQTAYLYSCARISWRRVRSRYSFVNTEKTVVDKYLRAWYITLRPLASHSANIWLFNFSILRSQQTTAPFNRYFCSPGASTTGPQAKFYSTANSNTIQLKTRKSFWKARELNRKLLLFYHDYWDTDQNHLRIIIKSKEILLSQSILNFFSVYLYVILLCSDCR